MLPDILTERRDQRFAYLMEGEAGHFVFEHVLGLLWGGLGEAAYLPGSGSSGG